MDLEAYLSSQETGQWDSVGGFTIALEKAREKMAKFAMEHPSLYILKLIQATVVLGSERVGLSFHERSLMLWWDAPAPEGLAAVMAAVENPLLARGAGWRLLAEGINIYLFQSPTRLSLSCWTEEERRCLRLRGAQWEIGPPGRRPADLSPAPNFWLLQIEKPRGSWMNGPFHWEEQRVRECCFCLPLEFHLNGYAYARRPEPGRDQTWLDDFTDTFWLCERLEPSDSGSFRISVPSCEGRQRRDGRWLRTEPSCETFCLEPLLGADLSAVECRAAYYLPVTLAGPDKVVFLKDGVVVETIVVDERGAGALALLDAASMTFDASGLRLVRDEKLERVISEAGRVWLDMATGVRPLLPDITGFKAPRPPRLGSCAGWGCMSLFLLHPLILAVSSIVGLAYAGRWLMGANPDKDAACRQNIEKRLDWLIGTELWPFDPLSPATSGGGVGGEMRMT